MVKNKGNKQCQELEKQSMMRIRVLAAGQEGMAGLNGEGNI